VRIGENQNPSTFGAVGDEPKAGILYYTFEWLKIFQQFGWQRGILSSHEYGTGGFY
jgi:hypothetical protein